MHKQNVHAAACRILGAAFKNNVKAVHSTYMPEVDPYVLRQSNKLAMDGDWRGANTLVREHMRANLCKGAIVMANEDRAANPGGGILLAVETLAEAKHCVELLNKERNGFAALYSATSDKTESIGVVVGLVLRLTGVDLPRLGGMLWLPTGGNVNTLDPLRMRSTREKQKRSEVRIVTIVPKATVLHRLYDRRVCRRPRRRSQGGLQGHDRRVDGERRQAPQDCGVSARPCAGGSCKRAWLHGWVCVRACACVCCGAV